MFPQAFCLNFARGNSRGVKFRVSFVRFGVRELSLVGTGFWLLPWGEGPADLHMKFDELEGGLVLLAVMYWRAHSYPTRQIPLHLRFCPSNRFQE